MDLQIESARVWSATMSPHVIPGSTISALRGLFVRMMERESEQHGEGAPDTDDDLALLDALRDLCSDAHEHAVRAEQLVIAIKQGWTELHHDHPRLRTSGPDELLNHVISACIDQYYADTEVDSETA